MTKDRIKELQKAAPWPGVAYRRLSRQGRNNDLQSLADDGGLPFTAIEMDKEDNVAEFFAQIDLTQRMIDKIGELAKEVEQIQKKMLEAMPDPKLGQQLDDKTTDIKTLAYDVSAKLKKMEQAQEEHTDINKASAQWRIREVQVFNIIRRFREIMNHYNHESVLHRDRCKRVIVRELEITGNRRSDAELEDMFDSGFPGTFNFSILVDIEKAKQAANQIEARHQDITRLENSIRELHAMFLDLAQLVTTQGDMIDNIEHNVGKAAKDVEHAKVEVIKAHESNKAATKKKFIVFIILIAIVLILILIFSAYYAVQKNLLGIQGN